MDKWFVLQIIPQEIPRLNCSSGTYNETKMVAITRKQVKSTAFYSGLAGKIAPVLGLKNIKAVL